MSGFQIDSQQGNSFQRIVKNEWNPKPHIPKITTEMGNSQTLFRNQNELKAKPIQKPIGEFTDSMLNDNYCLEKENCLEFSLGGK
jgi:hypothetical protein